MKLIKLYILMFLCNFCFGQQNSITELPVDYGNNGCETAYRVCSSVTQTIFDPNAVLGVFSETYLYYFEAQESGNIDFTLNTNGASVTVCLYESVPESSECVGDLVFVGEPLIPTETIIVNGGVVNVQFPPGAYPHFIKVMVKRLNEEINFSINLSDESKEFLGCAPEVLCTECITSFSPKSGKYVVSAWVKEEGVDGAVTTYTKPSINLSFVGSSEQYVLTPKGEIIDGWQRIETEIEVPTTATGMDIELFVSEGEAYFDDIRFFPFDGSMMSYVYDPESLRLMAELDERNYATFYEYDEEGKLVRVKKETARGVMTIQENRDNTKKQ